MVLASAFTEGSANDWLAIAFVDGHHTSDALGVLGLGIFLIFMTLGRTFGTIFIDKYGRLPVLRISFASALIGSLMLIFEDTTIAFIGSAIWGIGASLGFPVGVSAAADDPLRAAKRLSVVTTIGYGAFLAGPALIGLLGDWFGVLRALLVVGLFAIVAFIAAPASRPIINESQSIN